MEYSTGPDFVDAWHELFRLLFLLAIPAAVVVARHRPSWLLRAWLATWLVLVGSNLIRSPYHLEDAPWGAGVEIGLVGVLTGLPVLWLYLGRRHPVLSRPEVQVAGAVATGGMALVVFVAALG
jgi:hypothetical protein